MLAVEIAAFRYQSDYDRESIKKCKEIQGKVIVIVGATDSEFEKAEDKRELARLNKEIETQV